MLHYGRLDIFNIFEEGIQDVHLSLGPANDVAGPDVYHLTFTLCPLSRDFDTWVLVKRVPGKSDCDVTCHSVSLTHRVALVPGTRSELLTFVQITAFSSKLMLTRCCCLNPYLSGKMEDKLRDL